MAKQLYKVWGDIAYPICKLHFPNFNSAAVEVLKLIINFLPYFILEFIIYSRWDYS